MKRYLIADTHFGHANIIEYEKRPFDTVEEMDEKLIELWNSTVGKDDLIYVLGDFTLSRRLCVIESLVKRLHGRKILIMGNHDTRKPKDYIQCGFEVATRKPMMVEPGVILMHEPFDTPEYIASNYIYFYGHVHNNLTLMDDYHNCKCVCVERTNYRPIELDKAIKIMKESPNRKTIEAIKEVERLEKDSTAKTYKSVEELVKDLKD